MKIIFHLLVCLLLPTMLLAQERSTVTFLSMTWEQNQQWLLTLKAKEKPLQWKLITDRYFQSNAIATHEPPRLFTPVLIVNGLPIFITDSTSEQVKRKLLFLLTEDKIADIKVLEKQPEGLYIEKPFTGIIIATVSDRRTGKALKKVKIH